MRKPDARTFGQDLMRGEHVVRATPPGLTWVGGDRDSESLDDTSRQILAASSSGTSIFDPVLCELAYRWFCPPGGVVLDPFAGGSVRGIVASNLGRSYIGVDLSERQVAANREQAAEICDDPMPVWHQGDSRDIRSIAANVDADFVFSCPPYADLERYSDDPQDLSTMGYEAFLDAYRIIIAETVARLKPNRFACFVVGDVRDKAGFYLGFPWHTIDAFAQAGARLYNEAILVTAAGSLPLRAGKQFAATRKLGKTHQQVLVFCKGEPRKATEAVGEVEFGETEVFPSVGESAVDVRVSAAMARLMFTECGPECIKYNECQGNCCDAPSRPSGCMVTIHPDEQARIEARGGVVVNGMLQPTLGKRGCPFKENGLCGLHYTPDKPFGCVASPFTLTKAGTLIVRNRYKMLPCYKGSGPKAPAYMAFRSSLNMIFGQDNTDGLVAHLDAGGGDLTLPMDVTTYRTLRDNDEAKHQDG